MFRTIPSTCAGLLIGLIVFGQPAHTQSPAQANNPVIKSADLEWDVEVLRHAYEELHPGLYRYNTKAEMDARFEALRKKFSQDRSLPDAYLAFSHCRISLKERMLRWRELTPSNESEACSLWDTLSHLEAGSIQRFRAYSRQLVKKYAGRNYGHAPGSALEVWRVIRTRSR